MPRIEAGQGDIACPTSLGALMKHLYLGVEVGARPNGQRVTRLLREIQSTCTVERRRKVQKSFQGPERRVSGSTQSAAVN